MNAELVLRIPKILHHTSNNIVWEEQHILHRAAKIMPEFRQILWSDEENLALFEKHFPKYVDQFRTFTRGVIRADISRCLYLHAMGGTYADTDYLFYKPLDAQFLSHRCVLGIEEGDAVLKAGHKYGNAFMASEPGFPLWMDFVESIFYRHAKGEESVVHLSGPHALSLFLEQHPAYMDQITVLPAIILYPSLKWMKLSTTHDTTTIGAHLCWGSWRDKNKLKQFKNRTRRWISAML